MDDRAEALERLRPYVAQAEKFSGWDTSRFSPDILGPPLPWDYEAMARARIFEATRALDIGTGGGELLARLIPGASCEVTATESWDVNYDIAGKRLRPLGVRVVYSGSLVLPFEDGEFDLVLNRHEELEPAEVARVLAPGGRILTQQVGNDSWPELRPYFPRRTDWGDLRGRYVAGLTAAGVTCTSQEQRYRVAFRSIGQLAGMLAIAPWEIPDFDPLGADLEALLALERDCTTRHGLELTETRFLIEGTLTGGT